MLKFICRIILALVICFVTEKQARQAYLVGNKALAKELSDKGKLHNVHMKAAHGKAQESIYRQRFVVLCHFCLIPGSHPLLIYVDLMIHGTLLSSYLSYACSSL